jgi:hypothetical protein
MAGTAVTVTRSWGLNTGSALKALYDEHNKVITDLETLRTHLSSLTNRYHSVMNYAHNRVTPVTGVAIGLAKGSAGAKVKAAAMAGGLAYYAGGLLVAKTSTETDDLWTLGSTGESTTTVTAGNANAYILYLNCWRGTAGY